MELSTESIEQEPLASTSSIPIETTSLPLLTPSTETPPIDPTTPSTTTGPPLGKKAAKRLAKKLLWDARKPERKAKDKVKVAQKKELKRKMYEDGTLERPISKKGKLAEAGRRAEPFGARIVLDMGFDKLMTEKEIMSIDKQLAFCYTVNRHSVAPVKLLITSLNGQLKHRMDTVSKGLYQNWKDVEWWGDSYERLWEEEEKSEDVSGSTSISAAGSSSSSEAIASTFTFNFNPTTSPITLGIFKGQPQSRTPKSNVVYLTGDSPNVLTHLSPDETYIIGGIVDKNRYKLLCYNQAEAQGVRHAQLPIGEFLPQMSTRKILTVNQVFAIMVGWCEERDWEVSMKNVMPTRKLQTEGKKERRAKKHSTNITTGAEEEEGEAEFEGEGEEEDGEEEAWDDSIHIAKGELVDALDSSEVGVLGL